MAKSARALALLLSLAGASAPAAVLTVDIVGDEDDGGGCVAGDCSLREALGAAANGDEIQFALPGVPPWTIRLQTGAGLGTLVVDVGVTITGPGMDQLIVSGDANADGTPDLRVLRIDSPGALSAAGLTIRDGRATSVVEKHGGCVLNGFAAVFQSVRFENCRGWDAGLGQDGGDGGAIYAESGTTLTLDGCVLASNRGGTGGETTSGTDQYSGGRGGAIAGAGTIEVYRSTFTGNRAGSGGPTLGLGGSGGAIAMLAGGSLRVDESVFDGNASGDGGRFQTGPHGPDGPGGAIHAGADATFNNVTLAGNTIGSTTIGLSAQGGAIQVGAGTTRLRNVTVAGNTANGAGGGIVRAGGTMLVRNSLIALNSGSGANDDCFTSSAGSLVSEDHNLVGVVDGCAASFIGANDQVGTAASPLDPALGPLAANGGPTRTRALLAGSPAIDAGEAPDCLGWVPDVGLDVVLDVDQRGFLRPVDGDGDTTVICDIGAYELSEPPPSFPLDVALAGAGTGSVASTPPGIACPTDCTESYPPATVVDLTPTADAGSAFTGWSGDCSGAGACSVTMDAARAVTATFQPLHTLTVSVTGSGSVASVPPGISCPSDCTEDYLEGTSVSLTPTPAAGWAFASWSGACTGSGACTVEMTANRSVTATFVPLRTLTVSVVGTGTVTSVPAGISCPADCTEQYLDGTVVTLDATPAPGFLFAAWSGDCTGSGPCMVTMDQARAVTATFTPIGTFPLDVTVSGDGDVVSTPPGITCPTDCTETYTDGTVVSLAATPHGDSHFVGWSGDCAGTGACEVTMSQARAVTATFDTLPFLDGFETGDTSRWSSRLP